MPNGCDEVGIIFNSLNFVVVITPVYILSGSLAVFKSIFKDVLGHFLITVTCFVSISTLLISKIL